MSEFKDFTVTYTVQDVYDQGVPTIPAGYTAEFRLPKHHEKYLNRLDGFVETSARDWNYADSPRLVLTPIRRKVITFVETGEVRPPQHDEWYGVGEIVYKATCYNYTGYYSIYTHTKSFQ